MKKKLFLILFAIITFIACMPIQVFAADDKTFLYELTIDGKDVKKVETGDIITVLLKLYRTDSDEIYAMYSMQDEIRYDSTFFELVDGGAVISSGINVTDIANVDHNREFYMNYLSFTDNTMWNADTLIGSFQLKVIAENGITNITNQDYLVSYKDGTGSYVCDSSNVKVVLSDECTVVFDSKGGSDVPVQKVTAGNRIRQPKSPVKDGVYFAGWYEDYELTDKWDFNNDTVEQNMHLYAKWTTDETLADTSGDASGRCCWLWLILLLIIVYIIYKYQKKKKSNQIHK